MIHDITDKFERTDQDGGDAKEKSNNHHLLDDPFKKQVSSPTYQSPANNRNSNSFVDVSQSSFLNDKA